MKIAILVLTTLIALPTLAEKQRVLCDSSKEFITSLEFLRKQAGESKTSKELENRKLANYISKHCSGAAKRFIKVVILFEKMDLGINNAISVAKQAVKVEDDRVDLFLKVFKRLYLKNGFDLSPNQSLQIARSFLKPTKVPAASVYREFNKLANYCESRRKLARNPYDCALIIRDLVASLDEHETKIAKHFINTYEYLTTNESLSLSSFEAVKLSRKLLAYGPNAIQNFLLAVKYAVSNQGLNLTRKNALKFGEDMAKRSSIKTELKFVTQKRSSWWKLW